MKFSTKLSLLSLAILGINCVTAEANVIDLAKRNNNPQATIEYWTPERLKAAKPMDLPKVDSNKLQQIKLEDDASNLSTQSAPPTLKIKPQKDLLFVSENENLNENLNGHSLGNVGTQGLHFSSSRLVPLSADLSYPYRAVGKLFFSDGSSNFVCSASVIANRLVVTAGHCVHRGTGGDAGFFTNFLFIPAFRDNNAPFQRWTWAFVNTTNEWKAGGGNVPNAGDFALLEMNDNVVSGQNVRVADVTGKLGVTTNKLSANHLHLLGYPCNLDSCQKMHQVAAQNGPAVAPNNVMYGSDMRGGSSGGPWVQNFGVQATGQSGGQNPGLNQVVAVTSWGFVSTTPLVQGASNFNNTFTTLFNQMCAHKVGNC